MRYSRTKNSVRNIVLGTISIVVNILFPFIVRTVLINKLGVEYAGISSLFSSILSMLSLTELGIGSAMVYSLYEPIANENHEKINNILNSYRKIYRGIGILILFLGLILVPFLNLLIKDETPADINIRLVFVIYIVDTAVSYLLFAYKESVLNAYQRNDLEYFLTLVMNIIRSVMQICVICLFRSYYLYALCMPLATVGLNLGRRYIVNKSFPMYARPYGGVDEDFFRALRKKIAALIGHQANYTIINSADNIVLSAFCGVRIVGIYGNYYMIYKAAESLVRMVTTSVQAGIGNSLVTDSEEKVYSDFKTFSYIVAFGVGIITTAFLCMIQNFVCLWQGEQRVLPDITALLLSLCLLITQIRRIIVIYKNAAGLWWEDRYKPYVVAACDLFIDLAFVTHFGINAVIVSTIVSVLFVETPWEIVVLFRCVFHRNSREYFIRLFAYFSFIVIFALASYGLCGIIHGNTYMTLLLRGFISVCLPAAGYALVSFRTAEFKKMAQIVGRIIRK